VTRIVGIAISALLSCASIELIASAQTPKKPTDIESEVRQVFDRWSTALTRGDKKTYLDTFWNSPRLVIRVSGGEWRGFDADYFIPCSMYRIHAD
jgi:hypothetical protein